MSVLFPRLPDSAAKALYEQTRSKSIGELTTEATTSHLSQYFAPSGGTRVTADEILDLRRRVCEIAAGYGFPGEAIGRRLNRFDTTLAATLHSAMGLVPAEAAERRLWAFLALVVLPDIAVWRFPSMSGDRMLATDITRHVFGRLWWRAELLHDPSERLDPYHLLNVFWERNFDQILARRKSIGGSPELVRALAKAWPKSWLGAVERDVLVDTLKHLMRRGAFQDLFGLPEGLLHREVAATISEVRAAHGRTSQAKA